MLLAALPWQLLLTFLVAPMVSSSAFRAFSCEEFDDGYANSVYLASVIRLGPTSTLVLTQSHTLLCLAILQQTQPCPHRRSFLRADYAVDCSDTRVELLAWLGILLYPVGRPVG